MIYEFPIGYSCNDITVCVECDFYGYVAAAIAERAEKCYNNTNEKRDKLSPNQS